MQTRPLSVRARQQTFDLSQTHYFPSMFKQTIFFFFHNFRKLYYDVNQTSQITLSGNSHVLNTYLYNGHFPSDQKFWVAFPEIPGTHFPERGQPRELYPNFQNISDRECPFHLILRPQLLVKWCNNFLENFKGNFHTLYPRFDGLGIFGWTKSARCVKCSWATCLVVQTLDKRLKIFLGTVQEPTKT